MHLLEPMLQLFDAQSALAKHVPLNAEVLQTPVPVLHPPLV